MDLSEGEESGSFLGCVLYMAITVGIIYLFRRWIKGGQFNERVSAKGLICVVTGANSGIGQEIVQELNLRKADVYMLCRSEQRAEQAKRELVRKGCDASRLTYINCDLTSFASIRRAAAQLSDKPQIDILINNAGIMYYPHYELTEDGHEMTWQSNHLGPFLLTELLLPQLRRAPAARIVNVASLAHTYSDKIDLDKIDTKKYFGKYMAYNMSKLANVMHARGMSRRLQKESTPNVTINSCHPGVVDTNLGRHLIVWQECLKKVTTPLRWLLLKTNRDGAQTALFLALSKKVDGISGKYFSDCALAKEISLAQDDQACEDLYNYSLEVTGVKK